MRVLPSIAILLGVLVADVARADEPAGIDAPLVDPIAVRHFDEGRRALSEKRIDDAIAELRASLVRSSSPNARLFLAKAYLEKGRIGTAYALFNVAEHEAGDRANLTGERRYLATKALAAKERADLEERVPRIRIVVRDDASAGLVVRLNGAPFDRATSGVPVEVDPGPNVVEASGPRLEPFATTVSLEEHQTVQVVVEARRLPTAKVGVRMQNRPQGFAIALDGRPTDLDAPLAVDPGRHTIVVQAPGHRAFSWESVLGDGEDRWVDVRLVHDERAGTRHPTPVWLFALSATATAGAGLTAGALLLDARAANEREDATDPLLRASSEQSAIRDRARAGSAVLIGAGVLALATVVLAVTTFPPGAKGRTLAALTSVLSR